MKSLPEKMVMAAIILSCGFVASTNTGGQEHGAKRSPGAGLHKWHMLSGSATAHTPAARSYAARADTP
jgi:hypothetical protein